MLGLINGNLKGNLI